MGHEVDEDGTWHLVALCNHKEQEAKFKSEKSPTLETSAFRNLLSAFYGQSYKIEHYDQLRRMVDLADYYCALSALSKSLDTTYLFSLLFVGQIKWQPMTILPIAAKLRNATLFRECIVWIAGDMRAYGRQGSGQDARSILIASLDPKLKKIVQSAIESMELKVSRVENHILKTTYISERLPPSFTDRLVSLKKALGRGLTTYWGSGGQILSVALIGSYFGGELKSKYTVRYAVAFNEGSLQKVGIDSSNFTSPLTHGIGIINCLLLCAVIVQVFSRTFVSRYGWKAKALRVTQGVVPLAVGKLFRQLCNDLYPAYASQYGLATAFAIFVFTLVLYATVKTPWGYLTRSCLPTSSSARPEIAAAFRNARSGDLPLPKMLRELRKHVTLTPALRDLLRPLRGNHSVIVDPYFTELSSAFFLCATLDEEDLPWDPTEVDY